MNSYNKETIFHLPGAFAQTRLYKQLFTLIAIQPDYLKDNVKIGSVYGTPGGIWNGGRGNWDLFSRKDILEQMRDLMAHFKIPVRFTFTNCLLEEQHLSDSYCNMLLEVFNTGDNEIICNKEILENYIREKYGNRYRYISSTTKRLNNKEQQLEEINKDYYLIVLDYDFNKNLDFLQSIPNKEKCELLCNAVCRPCCPFRIKHYENLSYNQLHFNNNDIMQCPSGDSERWFWEVVERKGNFISNEDINNIYLPMGFKHFKIEGRTAHPLDLIEMLLYYLIKDKYHLEIRAKLQQAIW